MYPEIMSSFFIPLDSDALIHRQRQLKCYKDTQQVERNVEALEAHGGRKADAKQK